MAQPLQFFPHTLIKSRRLHAAGITIQGVCRLHRIGERINSLVRFSQFVKFYCFSLIDDSSCCVLFFQFHLLWLFPHSFLGPFQQLHNPVCVKSSCHHQNSLKLFRSFRHLLRHILLPQKTAVLFQFFPWGIFSGHAAIGPHLTDKCPCIHKKSAGFKIFFPKSLNVSLVRFLVISHITPLFQ